MDVARKEKIVTFFMASPRLRALNREWANRLWKTVRIVGYEEIMRGEKGERVTVSMAGGQAARAAMTQHGEVMIPVSERTPEAAHWIVPSCRLINELGCSVNQNFKGMEIRFPNGKRIETVPHNGLNFIRWEDFVDVKNQLATSHRYGRPRFDGVACMMMDATAWMKPGINGDAMDQGSEMLWRDWLRCEDEPRDHEEDAESSLDAKEGKGRDVVVSAMNCRGDAHDANCGDCMRARGIRRQHRRGAMKHEWSVSADLSGPHPTAIGTNYRYLLVAVVTMGDGVSRLPFVKGLTWR